MLIKLIVLGMMKYLIEVKLILEHEAAFDGLTQPYINMIEAQTAMDCEGYRVHNFDINVNIIIDSKIKMNSLLHAD